MKYDSWKVQAAFQKDLSPRAVLVIIVPNNQDPLKPEKPQIHLVLDYHLLNKSMNTTHNGNWVMSYYSLPNITHLFARLQNCKVFSS